LASLGKAIKSAFYDNKGEYKTMTINELKQKIEEQKQENIRLFKIFEFRLHDEEIQPTIQEWREGSKKLKLLLDELYQLEEKEREERIKQQEINKETKTFINGFGEATNKYITSSTYERARKRNEKAIMRFIS
jgi:hypothetical protein